MKKLTKHTNIFYILRHPGPPQNLQARKSVQKQSSIIQPQVIQTHLNSENTKLQQNPTTNVTDPTLGSEITSHVMTNNNKLLEEQLRQMRNFERQQQEQFQQDMQDQRRILEVKQREYRVT